MRLPASNSRTADPVFKMRPLSALLCQKMVQPTVGSYSADHLIFGMGDALLQQVNRDTQRFGIKWSNLTTNRF
jgi:nicotinic acid phosphoribosyltransferase